MLPIRPGRSAGSLSGVRVGIGILVVVCLVAIAVLPGRGGQISRVAGWAALLTLPRNTANWRVLDSVPADGPVTYLVVGSDRRSGMPARLPALGNLTGQYADSIMLWSLNPDRSVVVLALPRDIRVGVPHHGDRKLGAVLKYGPAQLIEAVRSITSLPVHHYVEVDFAGFAALVDAVGGVDFTLETPIRDHVTGLDLPSGRVAVDGVDALRFVRARRVQELRGGRWISQPAGDLGRIARQRVLISALMKKLQSRRDPPNLLRLIRSIERGITVDAVLGPRDLEMIGAALDHTTSRSALVCVLPTHRQLPDDVAASPFPPQHNGSTVMRVVDGPRSAQVLRWYASAGTDALPANSCGLGGP